MSRKIPGLRAALVAYLLIVVLGLGAAAAHALWSQSGTVKVGVTAGTWGPTGKVDGATVTCGQRVDREWDSDITVTWKAVDATGYLLTVTPKNGMDPNPAKVTHTGAKETVSEMITLKRSNSSGFGNFTLVITPTGSEAGLPTTIDVALSHKNANTVTCVPGK